MLLIERPFGVNKINKISLINGQNYNELWMQEISFDWY